MNLYLFLVSVVVGICIHESDGRSAQLCIYSRVFNRRLHSNAWFIALELACTFCNLKICKSVFVRFQSDMYLFAFVIGWISCGVLYIKDWRRWGSEKGRRVKEIKARFVCQWIFNRCWSHVDIKYKKKYKICCTIFYPPRRYNFSFFESFSFVKPNYTRIYSMNDVGSNLQYLQYSLLNILVEE